ncbi:centrosomal protein of 192 kDa isoform X4 [Gouania willdenowi]|uniref:centrosomal protein of 192 kDa isoform X4 n=1 Tax=Gouania willdenowi TaxID=441366 RepID=UPI0010546AEB|nr:centrosomal protein of 192 kDa isoform X4 [Gouania willdenowi]
MAESGYGLKDEAFPSFLCRSLDSTSGRATLGNVTLGSGPGLPVAASTVAKIRPSSEHRENAVDATYLEAREMQQSTGEQPKFALSFKDDLDNADDFIAAHRLSDMLVKIHLDESASRSQGPVVGILPTQSGFAYGRTTDLGTELSTGLLTFTQFEHKDTEAKNLPLRAQAEEEQMQHEGVDSELFSGTNSSLLANENLMSVDNISDSDITDEDLDLNNLSDNELELYFNKMVPTSMQRGRVEGQEISASGPSAPFDDLCSSIDPELNQHQYLDKHDKQNFQIPDVRMAATGMDSCTDSDEDTENELRSANENSNTALTRILPSTSRQLVGESNHSTGRPGLECGNSEEEASSLSVSDIEQRKSGEGQVINSPVTGNAGGGDGSSGSEGSRNDSTIPLPQTVQTTYEALRGLGIVGSNAIGEDEEDVVINYAYRHAEIGNRVGPVGTGEASSCQGTSAGLQRLSHVTWNMALDQRKVLVQLTDCDAKDDEDDGVDKPDGAWHTIGLGECMGKSYTATEVLAATSEEDSNALSTSLEQKYFSQSVQEDSDDGWNHCPDDLELEFQQDANVTQSVVYQNEEGQWVTDLAYYSSFEKEVDGNAVDGSGQFQAEDFVPASEAMEKIVKDQEEFEKEHQFMQEEQIEPASHKCTFQGDSSWKDPQASQVLMRASQVSSEFQPVEDDSYLRLSLGQFFSQRSEALGCLGSIDAMDGPSFGYVITSPEKRDPFPLIHSSEFSSRESSPYSASMEISEGEKTLNLAEDFNKTIEAPVKQTSSKGKADVQACQKEDQTVQDDLSEDAASVSLANNSSQLMLSISTIASAIADASISTEPSQLAAMIVELSKRSRTQIPIACSSIPALCTTETSTSAQHIIPVADPSDVLQDLTHVGEMSACDMEKYLKNADISHSSDTSVAHNTFDLNSWAENHSCFQSNPQARDAKSHVSSSQAVKSTTEPYPMNMKTQNECERVTTVPNRCSTTTSIPQAPGNYARRSVGSVTLGFLTDKLETSNDADVSIKPSGIYSGTRTVKPDTGRPKHISLKTTESFPNTSELLSSRKGKSGFPCLKGHLTPIQTTLIKDQKLEKFSNSPEKKAATKDLKAASLPASSALEHTPNQTVQRIIKHASGFNEPSGEDTLCNFRPSTSPLTHSSPSQTSIPSSDSVLSLPASIGGVVDCHPAFDSSPQSTCSSPSPSRLTFISTNEGTDLPTPDRKKNNCSMALSTTIIRFSPTPPSELEAHPNVDAFCQSKNLEQSKPQRFKSLDPLPPQQCRSPEPSRCSSPLSCTRSHSECNHYPGDLLAGGRSHKHLSESNVRKLTTVDSVYCSNLNIQQPVPSLAPQTSNQWGTSSQVSSSVYSGGFGMPSSYSSEGLDHVPIPSFKPQCPAVIDLPNQGDLQSLLIGRSLYNPQLARQYLGTDAPGSYNVGAVGNEVYAVSSTAGPVGILGNTLPVHHPGPHQDMGVTGKVYSQYDVDSLAASSLEDLRGQVMVPEELRFPHACCVGIASQTSLSLFNPSERWQQVSITVTNLAIDGNKVDSLPYQWLIVKNKTIIGPRSTEEQKVLFVPPRAGAYQCTLSVFSWPASAETELAARANIFAKKVILVAIAENPVVELEVGNSGCLEFGDLPGGGAKALPLKLVNKTHATVPIRLVISANATAWRCFTFSKNPDPMMPEAAQAAIVSSPKVMNHVLRASYGENLDTFTVWVNFKAPQRYTASSEELGPADEYSGRMDVEVDSPGPSQVICSVPLRARSGIGRIHAPKDLQTVRLSAPLHKSSQQTLPLKNAGNIEVQLKLKSSDSEESFSVTPDDLSLGVGEEKGIVVSFKAQTNRQSKESLLTILVLPCGPQYEVTLIGEVLPEISENPALSAAVSAATIHSSGLTNHVPPILSNKQFVAWGGVTLGRAVQQKLVLRNIAADSTQKLRLLIRGQDQDCFQLQSLFSPEERLTRHGELSIRPKEDFTVYLLFAPTRVACMLAKLEIKQAGVRLSQPGVKFTIPLSGYGGTSNIILEDQRKQADGYLATLSDIAVSHVSKVCLCVRNTGSRAAFIKAIAFSDVHTRTFMDPSVISLSPSQFVLKERTQDVVTVLLKSTHREQSLCQSAASLLATVCLFCGDEVSRKQYRKFIHNKPEAAQKALSDNSLLRNVDFNEKFLGEEKVAEAYDLPQHPNEVHIFYSQMNKVVLLLMGSMKSPEDRQHTELILPSGTNSPDTDSRSLHGNVSLDVLPVKGPQDPVLRVSAEPSLKDSEVLPRQSVSWTIHPDQIILPAPTINGASTTSQVQIRNSTSRELRFDLSWPAHCLTVTPQHGVVEPQCHLQILISPNPSLATKSAILPWSGQMFVQCDGQQKFIKVQIRQDLALDVSAALADSPAALSPQVATPVLPVPRLATKPSLSPHSAQELVKITNKTIVFPITPPGETSEAQLEVQNREDEVRWYLSSFAPPYVKGVDNTGDVYRATYTAFSCSRVSGILGAYQKMQVPITFLPRDRGDYAQFWDLECHPVSEPQQKTRIRFQLCGTGVKFGPVESLQEGDCSLVKTEATVKPRNRSTAPAAKTSQEEAVRRGVYSPQDLYTFQTTRVGESCSLKVNIRNNSSDTHELTFVKPREPFHIKHSKYSLRSQHYLKLPVQYKPSTTGRHTGLLLIQSQTSGSLVIQLTAEASP